MSILLAPVIPPDLLLFVQNQIKNAMADLNCHQLGTVKSFNASKQTAEVQLSVLLRVGEQVQPYPLLVDVPVMVLGGGDRAVTIPIRSGDTCVVLFNDRDMDNWFTTGGTNYPPNTFRLHDLSDGLAIVGFRSLANPVSNYSAEDVEIRNAGSKIAVGELLLLKNSTTDLKTLVAAIVTALTTLDSVKTGGSAAAQIAIVNSLSTQLLKSS